MLLTQISCSDCASEAGVRNDGISLQQVFQEHGAYYPSIKNFVAPDYFTTANKIYDPIFHSFKGNGVSRQPTPLMTDHIAVPLEIIKEHKDSTLAICAMYVNKLTFIVSTSRRI